MSILCRSAMPIAAIVLATSSQAFTPSLKVSTACDVGTAIYDKTGRILLSSSSVACVAQAMASPQLDGIIGGRASEYGDVEWVGAGTTSPRLATTNDPALVQRENYAAYLARTTPGNFGAITVARARREDSTELGSHGGRASVALESWDAVIANSDTLAPGTPVQLRFSGHIEFGYALSASRDATLAEGPSRDDQQWLLFSSSIRVGRTNAVFQVYGGASDCARVMVAASGCFDIDAGAPKDQFSPNEVSGSRRQEYDFTLDTTVGDGYEINHKLESFSAAGFFTQNFEPLYAGSMLSQMNSWNSATVFVESLTPGVRVESFSGHDYAPTPVPEPATWALWIGGLLGTAALARQRARHDSRSGD